jgi:hypothetical protein
MIELANKIRTEGQRVFGVKKPVIETTYHEPLEEITKKPYKTQLKLSSDGPPVFEGEWSATEKEALENIYKQLSEVVVE